jgi:hypothetical protein
MSIYGTVGGMEIEQAEALPIYGGLAVHGPWSVHQDRNGTLETARCKQTNRSRDQRCCGNQRQRHFPLNLEPPERTVPHNGANSTVQGRYQERPFARVSAAVQPKTKPKIGGIW